MAQEKETYGIDSFLTETESTVGCFWNSLNEFQIKHYVEYVSMDFIGENKIQKHFYNNNIWEKNKSMPKQNMKISEKDEKQTNEAK
jgi:hypothetical protein